MTSMESNAQCVRAIMETVIDGVITIDKTGHIVTLNPATVEMFGYDSEEDLIGQNVSILMPEPYHSDHDDYLKNYHETGRKKIIGIGRQVEGKRRDGSIFPIELAVSEMKVDGEKMFAGVIRDISFRAESETRMTAILDTVLEGIITINNRGIIEMANPATQKMFGYREDEMVGQNVKMLMPQPYQEEHDGYLEHYRETRQKKVIGIGRDVVGKRKNGEEFPIELAVSEMSINGKQMFTGIVRDITERKEAEKAKEEFISTVSHELRTPLTSIRGSIGLLQGGAAGALPDKAKQLLDIAHNNTERLLMLINDILDLSKIESGKMDFNFNQVSLERFLKHAIEANQGFAKEHGTRYTIEDNAVGAYIYADEHRLMQVMSNLMSNAAKFAPKNSHVLVSASRHGNKIRISVTDHGCGIPEELRPRIFDKFTQADSSDTRKVGGTGLGLNITKLMVEKHNGRIDFVSELGVGTTFFFDLPELIINQESLQETPSVSEGHSHRVLICEDEPDIASLLRLILTQAGYETDVAFSAAEAEALLDENKYDAMTLDIMLPDKDGTELYADLRSAGLTEKLPVVFVSAKASQVYETFEEDEKTHWMDKPIDQKQLLSLVERAVLGKSSQVKHILHVEDDLDIRQLVGMLMPEDYTISQAGDLSTAKSMIQDNNFDLVLLDIGLPDGSGLDLIEEIKRLDHKPEVVVFSADDIKLAGAQEVAASLVKSKTTNDELVTKIKQVIDN